MLDPAHEGVGRLDSRGLASKGFSLLLDLFQANVLFPGLGLGATQVYLDQHSPTIGYLDQLLTLNRKPYPSLSRVAN